MKRHEKSIVKPSLPVYMLALVILMAGSSCISYNSLVTFSHTNPFPDTTQIINNYQPILIQPNDILHINVSSSEQLSAALFSKSNAGGRSGLSRQSELLDGYLVGSDGSIDFPIIGKIIVEGLHMEEAKERIIDNLRTYFVKEPVVSIRMLNFNIIVSGEVNSPGAISVPTERITLVEAITQAGDFTSYARRDSVLIIREILGERSYAYVNFYSGDLLNSPYFYLKQNDVIYVSPAERKIGTVRDRETRYLPWVSAATGLIAFFISIVSLSRN